MAKKNLSKKIKITITSFGILSCLYFVIAVWLKSDGVSFNPKITYDLLKDTLTLGAAFLAPVAAFVLFSDWREEHVVKTLHTLIDEIKSQASEIEESLKKYYDQIVKMPSGLGSDGERFAENSKVNGLLGVFAKKYIEVEDETHELRMFKQQIKEFGLKAAEANQALYLMEYLKRIRDVDSGDDMECPQSEVEFITSQFMFNETTYKALYIQLVNFYDEIVELAKKIKAAC